MRGGWTVSRGEDIKRVCFPCFAFRGAGNYEYECGEFGHGECFEWDGMGWECGHADLVQLGCLGWQQPVIGACRGGYPRVFSGVGRFESPAATPYMVQGAESGAAANNNSVQPNPTRIITRNTSTAQQAVQCYEGRERELHDF